MSNKLTSSSKALIGTAAIPITLAAAYADAKSGRMPIADANNLTLYVGYTMGTAEDTNSIQLKIEFSDDGTTWYRKTNEADSTGTTTDTLQEYTFAATGAAATYDYFRIPVINLSDKHIKVSVKETGIAANGGKCFIIANLAKE